MGLEISRKFLNQNGKSVKEIHKEASTLMLWERPKNKTLCLPSPGAHNGNKGNFRNGQKSKKMMTIG